MLKLYTTYSLPYKVWLKNALLLLAIFLLPQFAKAQCSASFTDSVINGKVKLFSTSTTNSGFPLKYYWNFGLDNYYFQGNSSFQYEYFKSGSYDITLAIKDSAGNCSDTFRKTYNITVVTPACNADFDVSVYSSMQSVNINAKNYTNNPYNVFTWITGDGDTTVSSSYLYHQYKEGGTYNICLIQSNSYSGCSDTACKTVIVPTVTKIKCKADFNYYDATTRYYFTANSTCYNKYFWDFGDGTTSTERDPQHIFMKRGEFNVMLISYGSNLNIPDTITKKIYVHDGICSANFDLYGSSASTMVRFFRVPSTKFSLNFGDGTVITKFDSDNDSILMHTYNKAGVYNICLIKTDTFYNCSDTFCLNDTVVDPVYCYAGYRTDLDLNSRTLNFYLDKNFTGLNSANYTWTFGDGAADSGIGKSYTYHNYAKNGTYKTRLIVTNSITNCSDTAEKEIVIDKPIYKASISIRIWGNVDSIIAYLITYNAGDSTLNAIDTGYFGTDIDTSYLTRGSYTFKDLSPGKYWVKLAPAKSSNFYNNYMPTYYDTSLYWQNAKAIVLDGESADIKYIGTELIAGNNPGGDGFIGGKVSQGANKKEGEALKDVQVMLLDVNKKPVVVTYSDKDGNFEFKNIAFGTYEVYSEVIGANSHSATATLSSTNPKITNVEIKVSPKVIIASIRTKLTEDFLAQPKLYPNPTQSNLYLKTDMKRSQTAEIVIYNITGQQVYSENIALKQGMQIHNIETFKLPAGLYMLHLKNASGTDEMQYKFIKIN